VQREVTLELKTGFDPEVKASRAGLRIIGAVIVAAALAPPAGALVGESTDQSGGGSR
jgi:hypothetical protein